MEYPARPKVVRFEPENEGGREGERVRLKWKWKDGRLRVTVWRLEIHGVTVVD